MLPRLTIPGLFVTGTDTGVGKTVVAAAIADHFRRQGLTVGVFKPLASGCDLDAAGELVCEDAERLRAAAGGALRADEVCPLMFAEALAPAVAARRLGHCVDWKQIAAAFNAMAARSQIMVIEGAGGLHTPLDEHTTILHLIRAVGVPSVCVSRPGIGTINHTVLTVEALRAARVECAGTIINRFPMSDPNIADLTSPAEIDRLGGGPVRCIVPEAYFEGYTIPAAIAEAIDRVDWQRLARFR